MTASPPNDSPGLKKDTESLGRIRGTFHWLSLLSVGLAATGFLVSSQAPTLLLAGLEMLLIWSAIVAVIQSLYFRRQVPVRQDKPVESPMDAAPAPVARSSFASFWQWVLALLGVGLLARFAYPALQHAQTIPQVPVANLRLAAVAFLVSSAILYFFTNYAWVVQRNLRTSRLDSLLRLGQIACLACATCSILTFVFISTQRDFTPIAGWFLVYLTLVLLLEPWLRLAARFFLPESQRRLPAPVGESLLIDLIFGSRQAAWSLGRQFEELLGMKMGEMWVVRFVRETAEPILLAGVVLAWLSTCLTAVPLGSRGVLVSFGHYQPDALQPGLHLSWPWPMGEIDVVETGRIREISLGFEQDLAGPMLWTERHFVGEQNLLVGDGESLLTVDVPIQYRISDAVAFLKNATDAPAALKSLAGRQLIAAARSRESFQIMTVGRQQMADELRDGLQREADRMGLGLEITFVALKDVHPPVDVAPAYEKVVSAQERKETAIDLAKAYEASVVPDAQTAAQRLVVEADAARTSRVDQATGAAARFTSLLAAERTDPQLFRIRLRYDALDAGLLAPAKIIVGLSGGNLPTSYLDLRSTRDATIPAIPSPPAQEEPPIRQHRGEMPEE